MLLFGNESIWQYLACFFQQFMHIAHQNLRYGKVVGLTLQTHVFKLTTADVKSLQSTNILLFLRLSRTSFSQEHFNKIHQCLLKESNIGILIQSNYITNL